jgi:hypothetical protein
MNCYKALKINHFSGSIGIDSTGSDSISGPDGNSGETRRVSGICNITTPFTDFTNRELKCRGLLDYRVANDPEIAANGWLIRRYYPTHDVAGLCSNCGLEGELKYENDGQVLGSKNQGQGDIPQFYSAGVWGAFGGPWFNPFQFCTRAQEIFFNGRTDRYVFLSGGGAGVGITALTFKCYDVFNGSASDSRSYNFPPTAYDQNHYTGSASGTFSWNITIT